MLKRNFILSLVVVFTLVFTFGVLAEELEGTIKIDGSSTVYPITQAMAEEFSYENPRVRVTVGVSGTGGGMEKFTIGETDISNASRPIKDSEAAIAEENGIEFTKFVVAYDGITVVVNPENDWASNLTVDELKKIWEPNSSVETWSDVRPEWPDEEIALYGPGSDSGTFDYFTEAIVGEGGHSRADYTASEDDNVLVQGIAGNKYALGYFGYAYYIENKDLLNSVAVDWVLPASQTIENGKYSPLARPIFIYVNNDVVKRPEVEAFLRFYFEKAQEIVPSTGYVALSSYEKQLDKVDELK